MKFSKKLRRDIKVSPFLFVYVKFLFYLCGRKLKINNMTAEDLLHESYFNIVLDIRETYLTDSDITSAMKEYARLKCEELLKIVAEKAEVTQCENNDYYEYEVDKDSILNAVDLNEFIK